MGSLKWFDLNKLASINNHQKIDTATYCNICLHPAFIFTYPWTFLKAEGITGQEIVSLSLLNCIGMTSFSQ